jgi:hypothetical protein
VFDIMGAYAFNMASHMQKNCQGVPMALWIGPLRLEDLVPDETNRYLLESGVKLPNSRLFHVCPK